MPSKYIANSRSIFFIGLLTQFFFLPVLVNGQTAEQVRIDSMLKLLSFLKPDSNKVRLLNNISFTYFTVNPIEGIRRGEEAQALAEKLNWKKGVAGAYNSLGANYWAKHDLLQAQKYYWEGLQINEVLQDKAGTAKSLHDLGMTYETQYDYLKALEYYGKALDMYNKPGDKFAKLGCLANIANVYQLQHNYKSALDYFYRSLKLCEEYGNERHIAYMEGRIGLIYNLQGDYSKALEYENKSLKTLEKFADKNDIAAVLETIGSIYQSQHNYFKALLYFKKALSISASINGSWAQGFVGKYSVDVGKLYLVMATDKKRGNLNGKNNNKVLVQKAIDNFNNAIKISKHIEDKETLRNSYQALSEAKSLQNDYLAALQTYKLYKLYDDSLNSVEKEKEMDRHELEYVFGKQKDSFEYLNKLQQSELRTLAQEKKLTKLAVKQQWLYSIIIFVTVCFIGFYFLYQYRTRQLNLNNELIRERAEKQFKETEHQARLNDITLSALRSQMNPHFIFNALNTIQSYIYSNNKKSASYYLGKFGELIRKILDNSNKQKITLAEEIHVLQLYIDIEKARFGDTFYASIDVDPTLDTEEIFIPPMLIQPYAENAIKHGLLHMKDEKKLSILINKSTDHEYIEIMIDDNGIGREKSMEINKKRIGHNSFANAANERTIDLINHMHGKKTKFEIIDKKHADGMPAGTTVIISIPIILMALL